MGIFDRMGRILSGNVHALLDRADDSRKSIDLLESEMREQIRRAREEIVAALAAEKRLGARVAELDGEAERWTGRAELALRADDEKLAREALVQKHRVVAERDRAEAQRAEQRGAVLQMKREIERMEERHRELERRKATLAAKDEQARAGGGAEALGARGGRSAFDELRKIEARIESAESAAAVRREVDDALDPAKARGGLSREELEARFAALESGGVAAKGGPPAGDRVDEELAALRRKIRPS